MENTYYKGMTLKDSYYEGIQEDDNLRDDWIENRVVYNPNKEESRSNSEYKEQYELIEKNWNNE